MSAMVRGLKRVAVRIPPDETCSHCGQATKGREQRRFGFLVDDTSPGFVRVRFLNPFRNPGFSDANISIENIIGIVGETFVSSVPHRPEVCERVIFFDRGRQRKAWTVEVEANGRVTLVVGDVRIERWVEELVLLPFGDGFHKLSEGEVEKLDAPAHQECGARKEKEGEKEKSELLKRAERGAEELRALLAELESS